MSFDALLGNEQLKKDLARSLQTGHISHCYLITGPEGSGKHTLARLLAAAILCQGRDKPCGLCRPCRKVMEGGHPDFITWEDPDHQKIPVKLIRETFRPDVFVKPNESEHKIYLISQELGLEGQNALLTILEEPPAYAVFLLLAASPDKLLPTVRSRCRELKLSALPIHWKISLPGTFPRLPGRMSAGPPPAARASWARQGLFWSRDRTSRPRPWPSSAPLPKRRPWGWQMCWFPWRNGSGTP